ncbi:ketopantoate reductase PanE/ApbA C terminal-domain-containing protein [Sphaerosporella brunnea]|uniref:2-dehydropantoate 2-reductase n=1 Tax=Sphaerosporella brunnea TaxID=1250544 RepID=A0A5J5FBB3_9PEZI|nr:ketopantoate reductase PanE/ApbA C terminal-domain-containing protein [Sphaerosporella brunnea]
MYTMGVNKPIQKHIHILGVGNIGSFIAHTLRALRPSSPAITLLLRPAAQLQFRANDFKIVMHDAATGLSQQQAGFRVPMPDGPASSNIQNLIVATKGYQVREALSSVRSRLDEKSTVLLLQNGVAEFEKLFPVEEWGVEGRPRVLAGVVTHGVWSEDRFRITLAGRGETLIGAIDGVQGGLTSDQHAQREWLLKESWLSRTMERAGAKILAPRELLAAQIRKLAVNAAINALSAIYKVQNGVLFETPEAVEVMRAVVGEVAQVAAGLGLDGDFSEDALWEHVLQVGEKVKLNYSSMFQDLKAKRRTEVEEINGWVVEKGRELGVDTPLNEQLMKRVKALERQ